MEARKGMMVAKGETGSDSDERPAKLLCQATGSGARTTLLVGSFSGDVGAGSSSGVERSISPAVLVKGSSEGCSVFDCSALTGALDSDLLLPSDIPVVSDEEHPADVFVPGAARPVDISLQMIVKEIARHLHLELHDFGIIDEPDGFVRGWIEMDVPPREYAGAKMKERFFGGDALSKYAAMESVSAQVIKELCKKSGVIIKDVNYSEMKNLEEKLTAEKKWSNMFSDKLTARMKEDEAMRGGYESVVAHAKAICKEFKDVLPIETCGEEDLFLGMDNVKVVYNGPRDPVTRMDHLAFDLVSFVKKCVDLQVACRQENLEHVPSKRKRYRCRR